jgi:hypothetical protein
MNDANILWVSKLLNFTAYGMQEYHLEAFTSRQVHCSSDLVYLYG